MSIQGATSRLVEGTVASAAIVVCPKAELILLTGTTSIDTITPPNVANTNFSIAVVPIDGAVSTTTAGNIAVAVAMPQNRATVLVYSKSKGKWYPGAIS